MMILLVFKVPEEDPEELEELPSRGSLSRVSGPGADGFDDLPAASADLTRFTGYVWFTSRRIFV